MLKTRGIIRAVAGAVGVQYKIVAIASAVLASLVLAYSGYAIYDAVATQNKAYGDQSIMKYKPEYVDGLKTSAGDTEELEKAIKDYIGWLTIDDTHIDYPVVHGQDDMYYAAHDIYGESSLTGAIYLSALNNRSGSDQYNIIYGHHMQNGAMFGQILNYKEEAFYNAHKTGVWITKENIYELKCFSVAHTDAYNKDIYSISGRPYDIKEYLKAVYNGDTSLFETTSDLNEASGDGDSDGENAEEPYKPNTDVFFYDENNAKLSVQVLALSTCDTDTTNGRVLTFWTMVPVSEIPTATPTPEDVTPTPSPTPRPTATPTPTKKSSGGGSGGSSTPRVTNTPEPTETPEITLHTMSVRYLFTDGTEAAPAWSGEFKPGEEYSIPNPKIPGYVAVYSTTDGTMPDRKAEITVVYIPESMAQNGELSCIDQLEKNPNAIHVRMQLGLSCE